MSPSRWRGEEDTDSIANRGLDDGAVVESLRLIPRPLRDQGQPLIFTLEHVTGRYGEEPRSSIEARLRRSLLVVFLVSSTVLMLEVALTRVLSVVLSYHYVFAIVSLTLLGLGSGAFTLYMARSKGLLKHRASSLPVITALLSLSIPLCLILGLESHAYWVFFIPFFAAGLALTYAYEQFTEQSGKLYFADLTGAGLGSILAILLIEQLGASGTTLFAGGLSGLAAISSSMGRRRRAAVFTTVFLLFCAGSAGLMLGGYLDEVKAGSPGSKELQVLLHDPRLDARVAATYWTAFGRTDVLESPFHPDEKLIYIDGGAVSPMYRFNGDLQAVAWLRDFSGFYPFRLGSVKRVLIIGPGGGRDILLALLAGAGNITCVEVNPGVVRAMRDFAEFNGAIYDAANVTVVVDEGRSFVRGSRADYDLILLTLVSTESSRELAGYALTENYLYTKEAVKDLLSRLRPEGRLAVVVNNEVEAIRFFSTALSALTEQGGSLAEATRHLAIVTDISPQPTPVVVVSRARYRPDEGGLLLAEAKAMGLQPLFIPYRYEPETYTALTQGKVNLDEWASGFSKILDVSPTTDESPFFYKYEERGLPSFLTWLFAATLAVTVTVTALFTLLASRRVRGSVERRSPVAFAVYFVALGLGFMLIEVALLDRFILFLGQPTLTLSVILFSLLVGGGLGSLVSSRFEAAGLSHKASLACLGVAIAAGLHALTLPSIFTLLLGENSLARSLTAALFITPLGFAMGIPFPSGLRLVKQHRGGDIAYLWGINGVASVLGSVTAVVAAMLTGLTAVLALGALAYLVAWWALCNGMGESLFPDFPRSD